LPIYYALALLGLGFSGFKAQKNGSTLDTPT